MPSQFLFGWSKALVAVSCSLLIGLLVIMCTHSINRDDGTRLTTNRTDVFDQYVTDSGHGTYARSSAANIHNASNVGSVESPAANDSPNIQQAKMANCSDHGSKQHNRSTDAVGKTNTSRRDNEFDKRQIHERADNIVPITIDSQSLHVTNSTRSNTNGLDQKFDSFNLSARSMQQLHQSNNTEPSKKATMATTIQPKLPSEFEVNGSDRDDQTDYMNIVNCSSPNSAEEDEVILSRTERSTRLRLSGVKRKRIQRNHHTNVFEKRIERSANLSLSKATKRIQLLIKGRFLQILPDGTVNGTHEDTSEYTILQRNTVNVGQIRLVSIATCLYLCMDECGNLYSTREFSTDCVFNERLEHNYNYYTSTHHSTALRTFYIALNRLGGARKTHLPSSKPLGKLSTYVKAFTLVVPEHQSDMVIGKRFGYNHVKHGIKYLCESGRELIELSAKELVLPQCSSAKLTTIGNSNISIVNKDRNKHKQLIHLRHRSAPSRHRSNANANVLVSNCTEKTPNKKKHKPASGSNSHKIGDDIFRARTPKKSNLNKKNGKNKEHHRAQSNIVTSTVKTTSIVADNNTETIVPANDEEFGVTSTTNVIASNEQSTLTSEEDY